MATSRTGTAQWKSITRKVLKDAQAQGHTDCPYCGTEMDFISRSTPQGATIDHIRPVATGGTDDYNNLQVCCFTCNISKGRGQQPKNQRKTRRQALADEPLKTSRPW